MYEIYHYFTLHNTIAAQASVEIQQLLLSKDTVAKKIDKLIEDQSLLPHYIISEAERYIEASFQQGWTVNLIAAVTIKVEVLIFVR